MRQTFLMSGRTDKDLVISDSMPDTFKELYAYVTVFVDESCSTLATSANGTVTFSASPDYGLTYLDVENGTIDLAVGGKIYVAGCVNKLKAEFNSVTNAPYFKIKIVRY